MSICTDEGLKKEGVKEIRFYYKNDPVVGNIFTTCVFLSEDKKILSRGVCICSIMDAHKKSFAREKSKSRAIAALFKKESTLPIKDTLEEVDERSFKLWQKTFKLKDEEERDRILEVAEENCLDRKVRMIENYQVLDVFIPYTYPIEETKKYFDYKAEYKPEPTDDEIIMFKL